MTNFGASYCVEPQIEHTYTAIVLHGRGSLASEFAQDFLGSPISTGRTVTDDLPGWRWVFPQSKQIWSTTFQEDMPAWFEARSLTNPTARQDLQAPGIRESVSHILRVIDEESERLGGNSKRVVLGGISQGAAVALWVLLSQRYSPTGVGAFFAASTWLPFATEVENRLSNHGQDELLTKEESKLRCPSQWMLDIIPPPRQASSSEHTILTPVFMGHGTDDAYVDIELGRQASRVLASYGYSIEWKEYSGADQEGHWFKEPDEVYDIAEFLRRL